MKITTYKGISKSTHPKPFHTTVYTVGTKVRYQFKIKTLSQWGW